jgi:ribosomal-protein-alanine N-acetyltransferase
VCTRASKPWRSPGKAGAPKLADPNNGARYVRALSEIYLRRLEVADAEALLELLVREREFLKPWQEARPDSFFTLAAQRGVLEQVTTGATRIDFGIFLKETDELLGRVQLSGIALAPFESAYLGYSVSERYNGRGYATEAVRQGLEVAFEELGLHRVQAAAMPINRASIRVLEKTGFREEGLALRYLQINGVWEDHKLFAMTAEEWRR